MAITITADGHVLDKRLTVQQGGAAIIGATSILGNTGINGDLGVTGDFGTSGGLSAGGGISSGGDISAVGGVSAGGDSSFGGNLDVTGTIETLMPAKIIPPTAQPPLILGMNAQGQKVNGFNADLLDGLHSTSFIRVDFPRVITATHIFSPGIAGAPFALGVNAQGQKVDGLNADLLDGNHESVFMRLGAAQTITVAHTFNPGAAGAPFYLGTNAQGYAVSGLNSDQLDGLHKTDFLQLATAQTITARHTINPSVAGAPFILGANAQGHTVTGFDADTLDGNHASDFATSSALSNYLPLTGGTLSGNLNVPKLIIETGTTDWNITKSGTTFQILYGTGSCLEVSNNGKIWGKTAGAGADFQGPLSAYYFTVGSSSLKCSIQRDDTDGSIVFYDSSDSPLMSLHPANGTYIFRNCYVDGSVYENSFTIDTALPGNDKWDILYSAIKTYLSHNIKDMHQSLRHEYPSIAGKAMKQGYRVSDMLQIAVECIADLKVEINALKGKM